MLLVQFCISALSGCGSMVKCIEMLQCNEYKKAETERKVVSRERATEMGENSNVEEQQIRLISI